MFLFHAITMEFQKKKMNKSGPYDSCAIFIW